MSAHKLDAAQKILKTPLEEVQDFQTLNVDCHGVRLQIRFQSRTFRQAVALNLPRAWLEKSVEGSSPLSEALTVDWFSAEDPRWDEESDPSLKIGEWEGVPVVTQRDFLGIVRGPSHVQVMSLPLTADGYYNSLRWFLPAFLLEKGRLVLHSSCVVGKNGRAFFFLGPSGAGKTTIASLSGDRLVLGDDMNILGCEGRELWAESASLGGNPRYPGKLGPRYPVGGVYWIRQSTDCGTRPLSQAELTAKLAASCPLSGWGAEQRVSDALLRLAGRCSLLSKGHELFFPETNDLWRLIDG